MASMVSKQSISEDGALTALNAAIAKAREFGAPMAISVVDESGVLKTCIRMDGAPFGSVDISAAKARTASSSKRGTHEWWDRIKDNPVLVAGVPHMPGVIIVGGGVPIKVGEQTVGAIGASGGSAVQDQEVAEAGVAAAIG